MAARSRCQASEKEGLIKMKRYLVSEPREVNEGASKTGIKYVFITRIDDPEKFIKERSKYYTHGFRIKDSQTGEIIYKV